MLHARHHEHRITHAAQTRFNFAVTTMVLAIVLSIITARPALPEPVALPPVAGEAMCDVAGTMRASILRSGASKIFDAMIGDKLVVQVFANQATGEWVAMQIGTDGVGCIVAMGDQFEMDDQI